MAMINKEKNIPSKSGIDEEQTWNIIGNFLEEHGLVHHQLDSFNNYINSGIQNVINDESKIEIDTSTGKYVISFGNSHVTSPGVIEEDRNLKLIFPSEARNRDLNYDSAICCDITEATYDLEGKCIEKNIHTRVPIGRTPVMVLSDICNLKKLSLADRIKHGECERDSGGYFVIKGNERVIVAQLRNNYNQVIVIHQKGSDKKSASQGKPVKKKKKFSHIAEIRSMSEQTGHSVSLQVMISERSVVFSLPYIKELIPVGIVFKALGFCEDDEIINFIGMDSPECGLYMRIILRESYFTRTKQDALMYIGQYSMHIIPKEKRVDYALQVVESELFPHLGICTSVKEKGLFLGHMVKKLLLTKIGLRNPDDRDNLSNKRIETCGILCTELFRTLYKKFLSTIKLQMEKKKSRLDALSIISKLNIITTGLKHSFSTGNWGVQKNAYIRTGVSQVMSRMTFGATLSHARRIVIPIGKEGKNTQIRQIHASQFGYICPHETPEGQPAGIVLNFSLLARVTKKIPTYLVKEVIEDSDYIINGNDVKLEGIKSSTYVFLNGIIVGMTEDPTSLVEEIQTLRKHRRLDCDVSISYDMIDDEVRIFSDSGRAIRPLFTVGENGLNITKKNGYKWNKLVRKGLIEYVDCAEIENYVIAMDQKHLDLWKNDYMEIHPSMMLGVMGSIIPFSDHSPSPRNCYQCLHSKEPVLMADKSWKNIGDIVKGDKVITVDPNNYESSVTTVTNHYSKINTKPIIEITTETGRIIKCTVDHLLLTPEGWKEAKDAHMICIMPSQKIYNNFNKDVMYTLPNIKSLQKHQQELINMGLFPVNKKYTSILARITGFLLSNGSADIYRGYPQIQMTFRSIWGRKMFENDVKKLGFSLNEVITVSSEKYEVGEKIIYNNSFSTLLIGLIDVYIGQRSIQTHPPIPEWILNGSMTVKREFLSGFQGGNGCNLVHNRKSGNFVLNSTSQTSKNEHLNSLKYFMNQLKNLFSEFDIKCTGPKIRKNNTTDSKSVHLYFSNTRENLIRYVENIGWRYDHYKYRNSLPIYEYLKYCEYQISKIMEERTKISEMILENYSVYEISKQLDKKETYITESIRNIKKNSKSRLSNNYQPYQEWIKNKIMKKDIMFVNIDKKITQDNTVVCDITVDSDNHSFIAGDSLVVHNCSMGKQALGIFATSYKVRTDTIAHVLNYPQRPIVSTRPSEFMGFNDMPSGINAIVAIMSYTGFNQEDSVILNQSAIDRGLFNVTSYRTLSESEKKGGAYSFETIKVPPPSTIDIKQSAPGYFRRKNGNYSLLDENGVIRVRSDGNKGQSIHVKKGDVIIGKVMTKTSKSGDETYTDCSLIIKNGEEGIVDRVIQSITPQGYKMVKVVIRLERTPEVGDKFASRAAQKGTCGATYRQEDMPFNSEGICPDIIINPHCIPSRMTVNQLLETVLGKACVIKGEYGDSTPFTSSSTNGAADRICDLLAKAGMENASKGGKAYERTGWETLYNGMTGEPVKAKIFMGPTYYQRLKHMVSDKMHARANGHVTTLTRQPLEGRSRDGGLRFGEMERDCIIAHGASRFLKESLFDRSDAYQIIVCNKCGMITSSQEECIACAKDKVTTCNIPYAAKLLVQELMTMGVKVVIKPKE